MQMIPKCSDHKLPHPPDVQCGGDLTADSGDIQTPNFPLSYPDDIDCLWKIEVSHGSRITLTFEEFQEKLVSLRFTHFDLEASGGCDYDYIEVYDGPGTDFPKLGKHCGDDLPSQIRSSTNELLVKFVTDQSVQHSGFAAAYTAESRAPGSAPIIDKKKTKAEDAHTIKVQWNEIAKEDQNGLILGYEVLYKEKGQQSSRLNTTTTNAIIRHLKPYTLYCIKVQGFTKAGESPVSPCFDIRTSDKGSSQPLNVQVQAISSVSILVKWDAPAHPNGDIKEYTIFYGTSKDVQIPSQPRDVSGKLDKGGISITVSWRDPKDHNGIIIMYRVYFEGKRGYDPSFTDNHEIVSGNTSRSTEIGIARLKPGTKYSIYVKARTVKGYGAESVRAELKTPSKRMRKLFVHLCEHVGSEFLLVHQWPIASRQWRQQAAHSIFEQWVRNESGRRRDRWAGPPPPKLPQLVEADVTTTTITISLSPSDDTNGEIIRHQIILEMLGTARALRETTALPEDIHGYQRAQINGDRFYITAMFERRKLPAEFVLGNGKTYGGYENVPLKPGTRYKVYVRGVTERDGMSRQSSRRVTTCRHQIILEMLGTARALRETTALPEDIHGYQRAQINGDRFYITAMFERRKLPAEFVLGNGKTYGGYENVPLKPGTRYKVYVRGVTERDGSARCISLSGGMFFLQKWLYGEPAAIVLPKTDESPVVKEGDNMDGVIAGLLGALILILIAIVAFYLYQRSNRPPNASLKVESQKKEFELRRFNARVTAVESDQTQENLTLVPVSVTTQLTVSESNDHRGPETNETTLVYEEIDLFSPGMMVLSCF
ncbi:Tolloid-like protein 2 [Stylophora pistillata]|uniref:Tolloid-like protein 2 n=1 Tax=Stylophora pistillata TaxID=50429 RepID=A0A2B4RG25_STYPI|nr:Tolloid-like protein 2 [Stylophora pistillata]